MEEILPKVSVLIISYNQEKYIAETLESAVNQDYQNIEIVIADDCSTDDTAKIIQSYQDKHPNIIKTINQEKNVGITNNTNAALALCSGEIIACLAGDDKFYPGKIKKQVVLFKDEDISLSYHSVEILDDHLKKVVFVSDAKSKEFKSAYDIIEKCGIPGASSVMFRKSCAPEGGLDLRLPTVSDWLFFVEIAMNGKVKKLDGTWGMYRKHTGGASNRTYELLDESLLTLKILENKYPNDNVLKESCKKGRNRYLFGELFRQINQQDYQKVYNVVKLLTSGNTTLMNIILGIFVSFMRVPYVLGATAKSMEGFKYILKRHL